MKLPPSKHWFIRAGASPCALQMLMDSVDVALPKEYLAFLAFSDGGEGPLLPPYYTLCLDTAACACASGMPGNARSSRADLLPAAQMDRVDCAISAGRLGMVERLVGP